ncbi:MAG: hypothetical protein V2A62_04865 [Candidatus Woesearchaeota archaeon]
MLKEVPSKVWIVVNVSLGVIALLLLLSFFGITLPSLGQVQYVLDREEPLCVVNWQGQLNSWPEIDSCCLEARKQLECFFYQQQTDLGRIDWICKTGSGSVSYGLNSKVYRYCQQQSYWR